MIAAVTALSVTAHTHTAAYPHTCAGAVQNAAFVTRYTGAVSHTGTSNIKSAENRPVPKGRILYISASESAASNVAAAKENTIFLGLSI